jgi:hypothetical protein
VRSDLSAISRTVNYFVADPEIIDFTLNTLHARYGTDDLMAQVVTKTRGELRALESSPFFRQSPAAQGAPSLDLLSYQQFHESLPR